MPNLEAEVIDDGLEPGTLWNHRHCEFRARVQSADRRGVFVYLLPEPPIGEIPRAARIAGAVLDDGRLAVPRSTFRDWFVRWRALIPPEERELKSRFSMSLANLEHMHVFIVRGPERLRFMARSADRAPEESRAARRGSPPVPLEAIFVGTYTHPFATDLFLADLDDVLAQQPPEAEARPTGADAAAA